MVGKRRWWCLSDSGGGYIQVDTRVSPDSKASANLQTSNPAYVIVDITDPEQVPTILGEITTASYTSTTYTKRDPHDAQLVFVAVHREQDGNLHFLLTIGSGPGDSRGWIPSTNSTGVPNYNLWCGTNQTAGKKPGGSAFQQHPWGVGSMTCRRW